MTISEEKAGLRRRIRAARAGRDAASQAQARDGLAQSLNSWPRFQKARCVAAYLAMPGEPDLGLVIEQLTDRQVPVWLPITTTVAGQPGLRWARFGDGIVLGASLPNGVRIPEPVGPRHDDAPVDLVLLPGLAVDVLGHRLGQGGGFYDRTVARLGWGAPDGPTLVSVVFDDEVFDQVPAEFFDTCANAIVTPSGVREVQ